ncbi:hypothetical protein HK098_004761, partial [Nowakowskiella sp. JEL0407]
KVASVNYKDDDDDDQKSFKKPPQKKPWKPKDTPQYRDRAKERRKGINPDYEESEKIISVLSAASATPIPAPNIRSTLNVIPSEDSTTNSISYEQSKYLGGDMEHTHLVKGLDYELLKRVKENMEQKSVEKQEEDAKQYISALYGDAETPKYNSMFAESIVNFALNSSSTTQTQNEMFFEGRMMYQWTLGFDENDVYQGSVDIPTTVIRSRADIKTVEARELAKKENEIVIEKISHVMKNLRGSLPGYADPAPEKKRVKKKETAQVEIEKPKVLPVQPIETMDDDEDIFGDVGNTYVLEISEKKGEPSLPLRYFVDDDEIPKQQEVAPTQTDQPDVMDLEDSKPQTEPNTISSIAGLLVSAGLDTSFIPTASQPTTESKKGKKPDETKSTRLQPLSQVTSLEPMDEYDSYTASMMDYSDDEDYEDAKAADSEQVDLGTKKNKRRQLQRYDFDDEEQFQEYKATQVKMPKAAFSFGVKAADGGGGAGSVVKRAMKKGDGMKKEKLNREMQMVDKIMKEKYG